MICFRGGRSSEFIPRGCLGVNERTGGADVANAMAFCGMLSPTEASPQVPRGSPILSCIPTVLSLMALSCHGPAGWSPSLQYLTQKQLCGSVLPFPGCWRPLLHLGGLWVTLFVPHTFPVQAFLLVSIPLGAAQLGLTRSRGVPDANRATEAESCLPHSAGQCLAVRITDAVDLL